MTLSGAIVILFFAIITYVLIPLLVDDPLWDYELDWERLIKIES